jgi:CSLREA domain-containing protein
MITSTLNRATTGKALAIVFVLAALTAALALAPSPSYASATFTVNSTEDHDDAILGRDGCYTGYTVKGAGGGQVPECTLRAAISEANYTTGADAINFAILGSDVKTIAPETALPTVTEAVTINGYTQPGARPNARAVGNDAALKVELSGASTPDVSGLLSRGCCPARRQGHE